MKNQTVVAKLENKTSTPAVIIAIVFSALVLGGVTALVVMLVLNNDSTGDGNGGSGPEAMDLFSGAEIRKMEAFRNENPAIFCKNSFEVSGVKFCETDVRPCSSSKVRALALWRTVQRSDLESTLATLPLESLKRVVGEAIGDKVVLRFRDSSYDVLSFFEDYKKSEMISVIAPRLTLALYSDYPEMGLIQACNIR